jgi:hypothetical protein
VIIYCDGTSQDAELAALMVEWEGWYKKSEVYCVVEVHYFGKDMNPNCAPGMVSEHWYTESSAVWYIMPSGRAVCGRGFVRREEGNSVYRFVLYAQRGRV